MRNIILVTLALFLVVGVISAQNIIYDQPVISKAGTNYFQLANSAGDSTNSLGLDVKLPTRFSGQNIQLFPDSVVLIWYASADSVYSVAFYAKTRYTTQVTTAASYSSTFIDTAYSITAAASHGATLITRIAWSDACDHGFGISAVAKATNRNAVITKTASKIYVILRQYYHLP